MIVGLGHSARVGKDTVARFLVERHGFVRLAFADAVRDLVRRIDPMVSVLVAIDGWEKAKDQTPEVRTRLVKVGMACREVIGPDVWLNALAHKIEPGPDYVISDVRFANELAWIHDHGVAVKITRPGFEPLGDAADTALAEADTWDYTIDNSGDLLALEELVDELVMNIRQVEEAR